MKQKQRQSDEPVDKYVVFLFLDGIRASGRGSYGSLLEAYQTASAKLKHDNRANADYRIRGPAPADGVIAQLQLPWSLPTNLGTVWYALDASPARPPTLRARDVLRITGALPAQRTIRSKPTQAQPASLSRTPKAGMPKWLREQEGLAHDRHRRDLEVEDRAGDASLAARSEEELGLGIPAQTNRGRRSRRGDYIP